MILSATSVVSSSSPSRISLPIINDKVAVLLHGKIVWLGSLGLSLAGPSGCFVGIIDDQISVLLHCDVHRSNTYIVCLWSPFSVGRYPIKLLTYGNLSLLFASAASAYWPYLKIREYELPQNHRCFSIFLKNRY